MMSFILFYDASVTWIRLKLRLQVQAASWMYYKVYDLGHQNLQGHINSEHICTLCTGGCTVSLFMAHTLTSALHGVGGTIVHQCVPGWMAFFIRKLWTLWILTGKNKGEMWKLWSFFINHYFVYYNNQKLLIRNYFWENYTLHFGEL